MTSYFIVCLWVKLPWHSAVCRTANLLSGPCHLAAGDRVMVILPRLPQWWLINIACIRIGEQRQKLWKFIKRANAKYRSIRFQYWVKSIILPTRRQSSGNCLKHRRFGGHMTSTDIKHAQWRNDAAIVWDHMTFWQLSVFSRSMAACILYILTTNNYGQFLLIFDDIQVYYFISNGHK